MKYKKLSSGFLVTDLKEAKTSSGLVRLAPKILKGGAEQLARSATYMFALHKKEIAGASAAINAEPDQKKTNLTNFLSEVSQLVSTQSFLPNAGKGLTDEDFLPLQAGDSRPEIRLTKMAPDCALYQYCIGVSAVSAIAELSELEGKNVSIEGFGASAYGALKTLEATGANLVGISSGENFVSMPNGMNISEIAQSWEEHGTDFLKEIGTSNGAESKPAKDILTTPTDILFVSSKMGLIDHTLAEKMELSALVSLHPIPYTTKALLILEKRGVIVPPDFLCLGGQVVAGWDSQPTMSPETIIKAAEEKTQELTKEMKELSKAQQAPALFLAGCKMAEDFLSSWQEELPFGRAIA